jgi:hypothetical protein
VEYVPSGYAGDEGADLASLGSLFARTDRMLEFDRLHYRSTYVPVDIKSHKVVYPTVWYL